MSGPLSPVLVPVLLAGGIGARLWPLSRPERPKQFAPLLPDGESCFRHVARRALAVAPPERTLVVTGAAHGELAWRQYEGVAADAHPHLILEPEGRNTAMACARAALYAAGRFGADAVLWLLPCDGYVPEPETLVAAVHDGAAHALAGKVVTFGIAPVHAETDFGYLRAGERVDGEFFRCERFVEKPDAKTAHAMLADGRHFWNSGMFVVCAGRLIALLEAHAQDILKAAREAEREPARAFAAYEHAPCLPLDTAVMEKADGLLVRPLDLDWIDLGAWRRVAALKTPDDAGNVLCGDVKSERCRDVFVDAEGLAVEIRDADDLAVVIADGTVYVRGLRTGSRVENTSKAATFTKV